MASESSSLDFGLVARFITAAADHGIGPAELERFVSDDGYRARVAHAMVRQDEPQDVSDPESTPWASQEGMSLEVLGFEVWLFNTLKRADIHTVEQLAALTQERVLHIRGIGETSLAKIKRALARHDIVLVKQ